ncbi:hypothetical protein, partial [Crenobacter caeni]|uniref:hypothetical protein n=1 Tax=Crenobacter caeni TaxID=2705474 RepID=UPI00193FB7E2
LFRTSGTQVQRNFRFLLLAVQVLAAPSTHTYRLFVLLKSSDVPRCVRCIEESEFIKPLRQGQVFFEQTPKHLIYSLR